MMQLQFELQRRPANDDKLEQGQKRWVIGALEEPKTQTGDRLMEMEGGDDDWLQKAVRAADSLSFADAEVARKVETRIEVSFFPFHTAFGENQLIDLSLVGSRHWTIHDSFRPRTGCPCSRSSDSEIDSTPLHGSRTRNQVLHRRTSVLDQSRSCSTIRARR